MTTKKQQIANQQNALMSTGPKSEEGKSTSSRNSIRHGIFSEEIVITKGEYYQRFESLPKSAEWEFTNFSKAAQFCQRVR